METYELTTANGHKIEVSAQNNGRGLFFHVLIDGESFTEGQSDNDMGRATEESEAKLQADVTAQDLESGMIRRIDGKWRLIEDHELASGEELWAALQVTGRDEWVDDGAPENATDQSVWDFAGWNAVREHMRVYGWVILGGDLYARKMEGR